MGMDFVELVLAVEEEFDIKITDRDWQTLADQRPVTAASLTDFIYRKLPASETEADAPSAANEQTAAAKQAALRWLQQQLADFRARSNQRLEDIPSETSLRQLLGSSARRALFRQLKATGIQIPHLWLSWPQAIVIAAGAPFVSLSVFWSVLGSVQLSFGEFVLGFFAASLIPLIASLVLGKRWLAATPSTTTVGELAEHLAILNRRYFGRLAGVRVQRQQVWEFVQKSLADLLGTALDEIKPESRLIEDLGMD